MSGFAFYRIAVSERVDEELREKNFDFAPEHFDQTNKVFISLATSGKYELVAMFLASSDDDFALMATHADILNAIAEQKRQQQLAMARGGQFGGMGGPML